MPIHRARHVVRISWLFVQEFLNSKGVVFHPHPDLIELSKRAGEFLDFSLELSMKVSFLDFEVCNNHSMYFLYFPLFVLSIDCL